MVLFYASLDECHQIFVPHRTLRITEIIIDMVAAVVTLWTLQFIDQKQAVGSPAHRPN